MTPIVMTPIVASGPTLPLLDDLLLLLLGAMGVAILTRRWRIPYTVGLVIAGMVIGFLRHQGISSFTSRINISRINSIFCCLYYSEATFKLFFV